MSKKNYHHGDLKAALIKAATALLAEEGMAKLSLRAAARKAGVSQAAPYYHFKDKEALLASVAAEGFKQLTATMKRHVEEAPENTDKLQQLGIGYIVFAVENPAVFRLMQGPYFEDTEKFEFLQEAANESFAALKDAVSVCIPDENVSQLEAACASAWSLVHGAAMLCMDGRMGHITDISDIKKLARNITSQLDVRRAPAD